MKTLIKGLLNKLDQLIHSLEIFKLLLLQRDKQSLISDILDQPMHQETSQDPYHLNFKLFLQEANKLESASVLELGARNVSKKSLFTGYKEYIGFDIHAGENVDVAGDIHKLSKYFPEEYFHVVFSISVFEHLAMPWKAILEINKIMKIGGLLFIATHPTWPAHAMPWDFWRFSKEAFKVLLNSSTGFEIMRSDEGLPCSVVPFGNEESMIGLHQEPANLGVSVFARKCGKYDENLAWDVDIEKILDSIYPEHLR